MRNFSRATNFYTIAAIFTILMMSASLFGNYSVSMTEKDTKIFKVTTGSDRLDEMYSYTWFMDETTNREIRQNKRRNAVG